MSDSNRKSSLGCFFDFYKSFSDSHSYIESGSYYNFKVHNIFQLSGFSRIRDTFSSIFPNDRLASRVTFIFPSHLHSRMNQCSFADPNTTYSLYCIGCFQFIWFYGLSSSSASSVGPDFQGTKPCAASKSPLPSDVETSPPGSQNLQNPTSYTKIKESISANVANVHKIFNFMLADTNGVSINLDLSSLVVRLFLHTFKGNYGFLLLNTWVLLLYSSLIMKSKHATV